MHSQHLLRLLLLPIILFITHITTTTSITQSQLNKRRSATQESPNNSPDFHPSSLPCARGSFRRRGLQTTECEPCPKGTYGSTEGLNNHRCTGLCPLGRYNDEIGAFSVDNCKLCEPGKVGEVVGLTTSDCSGLCSSVRPGRYSSSYGLEDFSDCEKCPINYRGWQCTAELIPRQGTFESTEDDKRPLPGGEWSSKRYTVNGGREGENSWFDGEGRGAFPDNREELLGRDVPRNFDPAGLD